MMRYYYQYVVIILTIGLAFALPNNKVQADVIYDTLWIVHNDATNTVDMNSVDTSYDARLADDFVVNQPDGIVITDVTAAYISYFNFVPQYGIYIRIYSDENGKPSDQPVLEYQAPNEQVTGQMIFLSWWGLGIQLTIADLNIKLATGTYWIVIQPIDNYDCYYQLRNTDDVVNADTHVCDGDFGQYYGHNDWRSAGDDGLGAGISAMQISGYAAGPVLFMNEPYPGYAGQINEITATYTKSNTRIIFFYGLNTGLTPVPDCPGTSIPISKPHIAGSTYTDDNGYAVIYKYIPQIAAGRTTIIQAIDRQSCILSNAVEYTFPG